MRARELRRPEDAHAGTGLEAHDDARDHTRNEAQPSAELSEAWLDRDAAHVARDAAEAARDRAEVARDVAEAGRGVARGRLLALEQELVVLREQLRSVQQHADEAAEAALEELRADRASLLHEVELLYEELRGRANDGQRPVPSGGLVDGRAGAWLRPALMPGAGAART